MFLDDQMYSEVKFFDLFWTCLIRATLDRKSDFRNVVVSLFGETHPTVRIMVLREVISDTKTFIFFTDNMSEKYKLVVKNPNASLLLWDKRKRIQARITGYFSIEDNKVNHWEKLNSISKSQYGSIPFPSTPINSHNDYNLVASIDRFIVLKFHPSRFDLLKLDRDQHIRAFFDKEKEWSGNWVAP